MIVYFDFDAFRIRKRYFKQLEVLTWAIRESGVDRPREVLFTGHTCDLRPREYNRRLSLRRVREVERYLAKQLGEGTVAIRVMGKGKYSPHALRV